MSNDKLIQDVLASSPNRRSLLKKIGIASAAATAAATVGGFNLEAQAAAPSPIDVVQFALNLEYLESEFYTYATTGQGIAQAGIGTDGTGTPGNTTTSYGKVNFGNNVIFTGAIAQQIAQDEQAHVTLLRSALMSNGVTPIAKPAINLDALSTLGAGLQNELAFLILARAFEDIGVTAYAGAAQYLVSAPAILTYAARILAVEAEHAGNVRLQIGKLGIKVPALDAADILPPPAGSDYISADNTNGLVATRTPGQVLYLAYGNQANVTKGGFFPNGVNGTLNMSSAAATSANLS